MSRDEYVVPISADREDKPLISEAMRNDFGINEFANSVFQTDPISGSEKAAIIIGAGVGVASSWVFFPLGTALGHQFSNLISLPENSDARATICWLSGINSLIPIMFLGASSSIKAFRSFVNPEEVALNKIKKNDARALRALFQAGNIVLSSISGAQRSYLTLITLPSIGLKIFFASVAFLGTFLIYKRVFNTFEESHRVMLAMSDREMTELYKTIFTSVTDLFTNESKIRTLYNLSYGCHIQEVSIKTSNIRQCLGVLIGIIASYAYYSVGELMANAFYNFPDIGKYNENKNSIVFPENIKSSDIVKNIFGLLVALPLALMFSITTSRGLGNIYDAISRERKQSSMPIKHERVRNCLSVFASCEGVFAGIPAVTLFLAALSWISPKELFIFVAILGGTSAFAAQVSFSFFGVRALTDDIFTQITKDNDSVSAKKAKLSASIKFFKDGLSVARNSDIRTLYHDLAPEK